MSAVRDLFEFTEAPTNDVGASFIFPPTSKNLRAAAKVINQKGLVSIPTETVYGLAANALDEDACRKIFELKGRPLIDPLIVHVRSPSEAQKLAYWNQYADALIKAYMPGPLTIILKKKDCIPNLVTAGKNTVAIRLPKHETFQRISSEVSLPLAAPSANPFGYISPSSAEHVRSSFPNADLPILDGGNCSVGIESTIIDISDPKQPRLLRAGNILKSDLEKTLKISLKDLSKEKHTADSKLSAPGSLERHYSPQKETHLIPQEELAQRKTDIGSARVFFQKPTKGKVRPTEDYWFSESGLAEEAQRTVYKLLRQLDADPKVKKILLEEPPECESNAAIRDRLKRAASK